MNKSDDYKRGWYDGYQAAKREQQINLAPLPYTPPINNIPRCSICGMEFKNAMGYVCYNYNCPTRVSSSTVAGADFKPVGGAGANGGIK